MELLALVILTFVCLVIETTRKFGLILFFLLFLAFPLTVLCLSAIVIHFINRNNLKRSKYYDPPKLPK